MVSFVIIKRLSSVPPDAVVRRRDLARRDLARILVHEHIRRACDTKVSFIPLNENLRRHLPGFATESLSRSLLLMM